MPTFKQELVIAFFLTATFCGLLFIFIGLSDVVDITYGEENNSFGSLARNEILITIPEGFRIRDIEETFRKFGIQLVLNPVEEGYFFPDTYRFYTNVSSEVVAKKMRENFFKKVGVISRDELILASIVQKEVTNPIDMREIAGIFKNRLKAGIPLQADSTVNYFTNKNNTRALLGDTVLDSPYNTYKYTGLPSGPISNPGLAAIEAVKNSSETVYWYFLTTPDGSVIYSKSFEDHKKARQAHFN